MTQYMVGTIASLPPLFAYVYAGDLAGTAAEGLGQLETARTVLLLIGSAATLIAGLYVSRILLRAIR